MPPLVGVTFEPMFIVAQSKIPVPDMVAAVLAAAELFNVTAPVTFNVTPVIVNVAAVVLVNVNDAIFVAKVVFNVGWLVAVVGITTISVATVPGVLVPADLVQLAVLAQSVLVPPAQV